MILRGLLALLAALAMAGCTANSLSNSDLPQGVSAYDRMAVGAAETGEYRLGALDTISINVFQEPELSFEKLAIDAEGMIQMPLVGEVRAEGLSSAELTETLKTSLLPYLREPRVSVTVVESVTQKISVQGQVERPGVYDIDGEASLLEAIALAQGETDVAALKQVAVFRTIDGERMGAIFDVNAIRRGEAEDPPIVGQDVIVVGTSGKRSFWQGLLKAVPAFAVFRPYSY